eukprot:CAMPEP_0201591560 /NCGR_PEP_ID=MMETSP0190_2-20130828/189706_1 /ASSEMBLY_ACC=CAM_ASM_000263 /TAXON_ID=37353 /ORGANISM="Rosalina sp." /LENGTH=294 /DNA_ID=CAMNT_0048049953 /DNA_START=59 /DNA_END=943 /DNA_ORIENTATION=-
MAFKLPYVFKADNKEVVIQNKAGGDFEKFLRVKPGDLGKPDSQGGQGKFARFIVEFDNGDSTKIRLKSKESGKYLRIMKDGEINVEGGTGALTLFKVKKQGEANLVKLESNKFEGKYISVKKNGDVNVGNGGPWTELKFFREGGGGGGGAGGSFAKPYVFKVSGKEVVIQNKAGGDFDKFLRVKPGDLGRPCSQGGKGKFARFIVEFEGGNGSLVRLKSKESGKYLRIMKDDDINIEGGTGALTLFKVKKQDGGPNLVKLESNKFEGKYISVKKNGDVNVGNGGPWTELKEQEH